MSPARVKMLIHPRSRSLGKRRISKVNIKIFNTERHLTGHLFPYRIFYAGTNGPASLGCRVAERPDLRSISGNELGVAMLRFTEGHSAGSIEKRISVRETDTSSY